MLMNLIMQVFLTNVERAKMEDRHGNSGADCKFTVTIVECIDFDFSQIKIEGIHCHETKSGLSMCLSPTIVAAIHSMMKANYSPNQITRLMVSFSAQYWND